MPTGKRPPQTIKSINLSTHVSPKEYEDYQKLLAKAGNIRGTDFRRIMLTKGHVQARPSRTDIEQLRELRRLLIEYKTNFNRISNLIKFQQPDLVNEIKLLVNVLTDRIMKL